MKKPFFGEEWEKATQNVKQSSSVRLIPLSIRHTLAGVFQIADGSSSPCSAVAAEAPTGDIREEGFLAIGACCHSRGRTRGDLVNVLDT
jgi:hypothetical protein